MTKNIAITPNDTKYIPLTQQRFCCTPTCVQMIMLRHNIPLVPAELMGAKMGLIVPKDELQYFWNAKTGSKPKAGYGTQIGKKEFNLNSVLRDLKIPLEMTPILVDKFENFNHFMSYVSALDQSKKDILVCYDWGTLFNKDCHNGHVCVLDKIDLKKNEVRIIDPEYKAPKWRIVQLVKLFEAMKFHGNKNMAGFWEFEPIK